MTHILAFDGSGRADSVNRKALMAVVERAKTHGATVTLVNLPDFDMPLYDMDMEREQGMPDGAKAFKKLLGQHDGVLIASPEYNGAPSGLLKNVIDWASRSYDGEGSGEKWGGKVAGLISASPGKMGGLRGLYQLNTILFGVGVYVLPQLLSIGFYNDAFNADGTLKGEPDQKAADRLAERIVTVTKALK